MVKSAALCATLATPLVQQMPAANLRFLMSKSTKKIARRSEQTTFPLYCSVGGYENVPNPLRICWQHSVEPATN